MGNKIKEVDNTFMNEINVKVPQELIYECSELPTHVPMGGFYAPSYKII